MKDAARLHNLNLLCAYHKFTYMGERQAYYDRQQLALSNPQLYSSYILDGMQQTHSEIPYRGNKHQLTDPLNVKLQAVLEHGQFLTVFRSFGNMHGYGNLPMHCFLMQLERRLLDPTFEALAPTIFLQVDGGGENKVFIQLGALLVARGLCESFILTRLPVGHTHEDIDAR